MKFVDNKLFHSKELIPWEVAKLGREAIAKWRPLAEDKYWLKDGLAIAHRDNPAQRMYVTKICRRSIEVNMGENGKDGTPLKKNTYKIEGVLCHWFEE